MLPVMMRGLHGLTADVVAKDEARNLASLHSRQ